MFEHHGSLWRFWIAAVLFHTGMIAVSFWIARRAQGRLTSGAERGGTLGMLGDSVLFAGTAVVLAGATAGLSPAPAFAFMRLLCQAAFGEGLLLSTWLAAVALRLGGLVRGLPAILVSLGLAGLYWYAYLFEPFNLQQRYHDLDLSRSERTGRIVRIAHLSDIQTESVGEHEERALRAAMAMTPDLILLTGDYVQPGLLTSRARTEEDLRRLVVLTGLGAPLGVFAIQGDVDHDWPGIFGGLEITCLSDDFATVALSGGRSLSIVGLALRTSRSRDPKQLAEIAARAPRGDLRIVMGHSPDFVPALVGGPPVDLILSGHTHGGQVVLPFWGPPLTLSRLPRRFASGLNDYHGVPLHASAGIGVERGTAPPIRFLCPPEVCLLEVRY